MSPFASASTGCVPYARARLPRFAVYPQRGYPRQYGGDGQVRPLRAFRIWHKQLIHDYVEEIVDALALLASPAVDDISFEENWIFPAPTTASAALHC